MSPQYACSTSSPRAASARLSWIWNGWPEKSWTRIRTLTYAVRRSTLGARVASGAQHAATPAARGRVRCSTTDASALVHATKSAISLRRAGAVRTFPVPASPSTIRDTSRIEWEVPEPTFSARRQGSCGPHHLHDHVDCVVDEREVSALLTVVVDGQFAGGADLGDEARHHGIESLVGSVDVEEAEGGGVRARPRVHVGKVLERDLAHRVRRARRETGPFGDGLPCRLRAVHLARARDEQPHDRRARHDLEQVPIDQDIASDVVAVGEGRGHTLASGEMHHRRDAGEIVDPEIEHVDAFDGTVGRPQRLGRGEVVDTEHRHLGGAQGPTQVAPDESGRARDEHHLVPSGRAALTPVPPHSSPPR